MKLSLSNPLQQAAVLVLVFLGNTSFYVRKYDAANMYLVCDKSDYSLTLYDDDGWLVRYPVVFGSNDQSDKMMEGDKRTPEGTFTINSKRVHNKWSRFMGIDYPNAESYRKFKQRKENGTIPKSAKIGGSIGIHGTWPNDNDSVENYYNWTLGCISMRNEDVQELYRWIGVGTTIVIQK